MGSGYCNGAMQAAVVIEKYDVLRMVAKNDRVEWEGINEKQGIPKQWLKGTRASLQILPQMGIDVARCGTNNR